MVHVDAPGGQPNVPARRRDGDRVGDQIAKHLAKTVLQARDGQIEVGLGIERTDDESSGQTSNDGRAFLQWRSSH